MIINSYISGNIPTDNLVLYNRFDNNLTDETGNHTLSSSGISYTNGIYSGTANEAVLFNANTDSITVPDDNLLTFGNGATDSAFSISVAVNFSGNSGESYDTILEKRLFSGIDEYLIARWVSDGKIRVYLFDDSSGGRLIQQGSTILSNSTDYFITVTYDGSSTIGGIKIYIDGVEETYTDLSTGSYTAMENSTSDLGVGTSVLAVSPPSTTNEFLGDMDELGIWDKELSQEEVTAIYNKISAGNSLL